MRILVTQCGKEKRSTPSRAIDLYLKGGVAVARANATDASRVYILSALHGIVRGDTMVEPYEQELTDERLMMLKPMVTATLLSLAKEHELYFAVGGLYKQFIPNELHHLMVRGSTMFAYGEIKRFLSGKRVYYQQRLLERERRTNNTREGPLTNVNAMENSA